MQTQTSNALHNAIMEAGGKDRPLMLAPGINNDIYSTVDACPNVCEMSKAIKRLKQGESINVQDLEMNLYWEFGKFTSRDGESLESYYSRGTGYDNQRIVNVAGARETVEKADWRDDTDDKPEDQELEAHYMYMAQIQKVTPDDADNSGHIFNTDPLQKVPNNDNYNVFAIESEHPEQSKSVNDTYPIEQDEHNVIIDSLDMSYDREQIDQNDDDDDDLANEQSSNNHFKEANNELLKTNQLMYKDLKKFQAELDRYNDVKYASKVEIDCAKAKGDLLSYKMEFENSSNDFRNEKGAVCTSRNHLHNVTTKEAQIKFYKTREDKEIDKVIALENKVK
nr:hypothetical protein [Tanacetum cinerariifolium]